MPALASEGVVASLPLAAVEPTLIKANQRVDVSPAGPSGPESRRGVLRTDSRKVAPGDIFLAYKGVSSDGHAHIETAMSQGAALLVVENAGAIPKGCKLPWIQVRSGRASWSFLAAEAYDNPQNALQLLGITGTNGKTSTVWMTGQLLAAAGIPCLTIGTLGAYMGPVHVPTGHTTPDPDRLYQLMAQGRNRGLKVCAMEVSSHAIEQEKLLPLKYDGCAFTSFSRDHLDFHGTMDAYFAAKTRFFSELANPHARMAFAVGLDRKLDRAVLSKDSWIYGKNAKVVATEWGVEHAVEITIQSTDFAGTTLTLTVDGKALKGMVPYFATHALENFAASYLLASKAAGRLLEPALWTKLAPVPGRLEQVHGRKQVPVVVDYAHTPDALEKTLQVLRPFCKGRLVAVFGCGGDRDMGKRPIMGKIAETLADRVYLTSDNPRTEEPDAILEDIKAGLARPKDAVVDADRARAIARAVADAGPNDLVLVAGKGHETYQVLRTGTIHFDDREVARRALDEGG